MTITTRAGKGSALTFAEMDANLTQFDTKTKDGWADIVSEVYTRTAPNSAEVTLYRDGIYLYEFDSTQLREAFANFHMPHTWKAGTEILPHFHFVTTNNGTGVVRWNLEYTWARRHDSTGQISFPATTTISLDFTVPIGSAHKHFVAEFAVGQGIAGTGLEVDSMIMSRVYRDPTHVNDTFDGNVHLITTDLHIQVDRLATLNRAPDFYA